ncbi:MAG: hypothetical protein ACYTX0_63620, partial [Nostoc sp.]
RLEVGGIYKTKPQLAVEIIEALLKIGFNFYLVLADSLYEPIPLIIFVLQSLSLLRTANDKLRLSSTFYEKK